VSAPLARLRSESLKPAMVGGEETRARLHAVLGLDVGATVGVPYKSTSLAAPLSPLTVAWRRQVITFENMLGEQCECVLVLPDKLGDAAPATCGAVVCLAGTSGDADECTHPEFQKMPRTKRSPGPLRGWAAELSTRRRLVTLSITLRGHNRRNGTDAEKAGEKGAYRRLWETPMKLMAPLGRTMMGVMVDEVLRAVNVLPRVCFCVDPTRIGVAGFSLGGNVAWYSAACSPAIAACAPLCGGLGSMRLQIEQGDPERHSSCETVAP
jgi:hypothetical protein